MVVVFEEEFDLPPMPVDAGRAAVQGRILARKITSAGGVDEAIDAAVAVIQAASPDPPVSELSRLWALYAAAYTEAELRSLVMNTFVALGLARRDGDGG